MTQEISNNSNILSDASGFVDLIIKYAKLIRLRSDLTSPSPAIGSPGSEVVAPIVKPDKRKKSEKGEKPEWATITINCTICGIRSCQGTDLMERAKKAGKPKTAEECCLACNDRRSIRLLL